jgi:hypothetical protein
MLQRLMMKLLRKFIFIVGAIFANPGLDANAQSEPLKADRRMDVGLEGMIGASMGRDFFAFTVGGPSFRLRLAPNLRVGVGAFPSLYVKEGQLGAKLGASPRIDIGQVVIFSPFYHFESTNSWIRTVGLGYIFRH